MTSIYIARHGQNEDNANGILNGHRDLPLTKLGEQQARQLGQGIKAAGLSFDFIYASPLRRAYDTAAIVSSVATLPQPQVYDRLIERDFGVMTGKLAKDIERLCSPDIITTPSVTYFLHPDGAETFPDLVERGASVLRDIRDRHDDARVLLVCHGDIGKMIYAAATGRDWRDALEGFHFGNGDLIQTSHQGQAHFIQLPQQNE